MKINPFQTQSVKVFQEALKLYQKQFQSISKNIANVNNPNYVREATDFKSTMESLQSSDKMKTTSDKHIHNPKFYTEPSPVNSEDKTTSVDLTKEMTELAENQVKYEFATRYLSRKFTYLHQAVTGRSQ